MHATRHTCQRSAAGPGGATGHGRAAGAGAAGAAHLRQRRALPIYATLHRERAFKEVDRLEHINDIIEAAQDGLIVIGLDARAELLRRLLEADRRRLAVDGALAEEQHELLTEEGQSGHGHGRLVGVELGDAVD